MSRSELGRQVAVDLEADANLDEGRSGPGHGRFSLEFVCSVGVTATKLSRAGPRRKRHSCPLGIRLRIANHARLAALSPPDRPTGLGLLRLGSWARNIVRRVDTGLKLEKENRTLAGPVCSSSARSRQSPSRGEQLTTCRLRSGRMGNRLPPVMRSMPRQISLTTQRVACQPCGVRKFMENLQAHVSSQLRFRVQMSLFSAGYGTEVGTDGNAVISGGRGKVAVRTVRLFVSKVRRRDLQTSAFHRPNERSSSR